MKFFIPFKEPIKIAECLSCADRSKLSSAMLEFSYGCHGQYKEWLDRCHVCLDCFNSGDIEKAIWWSGHADLVRPDWIDDDYCKKERANMYKRFPKKYAQFHDSCDEGESSEEKA